MSIFIGADEAISNAEHLEEFIQGSGGTLAQLAELIVQHITSASASADFDSENRICAPKLEFCWIAASLLCSQQQFRTILSQNLKLSIRDAAELTSLQTFSPI
ncbi:hypothetical protein DFH06DRAFT_1139784 [Mycena polygramma]|nr:hypothetical protein DFH06DRAFT_1139784 [Mycena polygramma]